jgi:hypothetical protein
MKTILTILVVITFLTIGMFSFWVWVMKSGANILEYEHPSRDIAHAIDKEIFIDSLDLLAKDTIKTNKFEKIDIVPITAWIEKKTFWKSGVQDLDSIGFYSDTVILIINFKAFANGKPVEKRNSGGVIVEFKNDFSDTEWVYLGDEKVQLDFKLNKTQLLDTSRLITPDGQQVVIRKRR